MKVGSLFSGIGGIDLGLERAGMEIAWMCEWAKHPNALLKKKWPGVKIYEDIKETKCPPSVDLVCGGFPCQDVSVAGKRRGLVGARTGLFYEAIRILVEIKPSWILLENVPGLLSSNKGKDFATIMEELGNCGYFCAWRVLNSKFYGVPQKRRRVFIVGSLGTISSWKVLFGEETPIVYPKMDEEVQHAPCLTASYTADSYGARRPYIVDGESMPTRMRPLTPLEFERIGGFPDGWTEDMPIKERYKAIGNSVVPQVAEWIGRRIMEAANETPG